MLFDEFVAASRPLSLKDFNLYIFRGLRGEFRDLVKNILLMAKKCLMGLFSIHHYLGLYIRLSSDTTAYMLISDTFLNRFIILAILTCATLPFLGLSC